MNESSWDRVPIDSQSIDAPLSRAAVFLTLTVAGGREALQVVAGVLDGLDDLIKTVGFRDLNGRLSCITALGSELWDRFQTGKRPKELRPFTPIEGRTHTAPATPGDLFFHIRAEREDLCFEFERLLLDQLGSNVTLADEVAGFRYFDSRDLLGFVDGTANPTGHDIGSSTLVGSEDQEFAGGSYVVVQKYLHQMSRGLSFPRMRRSRSSAGKSSAMSNCPTRRAVRSRTRPSPRSWTKTAPSMTSCATTCLSAVPATTSMGPISSAIPGIYG